MKLQSKVEGSPTLLSPALLPAPRSHVTILHNSSVTSKPLRCMWGGWYVCVWGMSVVCVSVVRVWCVCGCGVPPPIATCDSLLASPLATPILSPIPNPQQPAPCSPPLCCFTNHHINGLVPHTDPSA